MSHLRKLDGRSLRKAFCQDLADAWSYSRSRRAGETPYAFVLYGLEGEPRLSAVVLSEESLAAVAQKYVDDGYYESLNEAREELRWSVEDSPNYEDLLQSLPNVDSLVEPWAPTAEETKGYKRLAEVAIKAFQDLEKSGLFGSGPARDAPVLAIMTPVAEVDLTLPTAKKLNSKAVYERLEAQLSRPGIFRCCKSLIFSPRGDAVYFAGSREIVPSDPENEFVGELVAADRVGLQLRRRWEFEIPSWGDSFRDLVWDVESSTVLALRHTYRGTKCRATLMRFTPDSPAPLASKQVNVEPVCLVATVDGHGAGLLYSQGLLLVDFQLEKQGDYSFEGEACDAILLPRNQLLLATESGVVLWDLASGKQELATSDGPAFRLRLSGDQKLLTVSRFFDSKEYRGYGPDRKPFGLWSYEFPSFRLLQSINVPDRQCIGHAMSDDGRVVAFEAQDTKSHAVELIAVDPRSGEEIARRRNKKSMVELAFLPGTHTLAIGTTDHREHEPIDFWKLTIDR